MSESSARRQFDKRQFDKRKARLLSLLNDPALELTLMEQITYIYHWLKCEYYHRKHVRAHKRFSKHAKKIVDVEMVYRLRKSMKDL